MEEQMFATKVVSLLEKTWLCFEDRN